MDNHTPIADPEKWYKRLFIRWRKSFQGQTWRTLLIVLDFHKKHVLACVVFCIALTASTLAQTAQALLLTVVVDSWQRGALPAMVLWTLVECALVCFTSLGTPLQSVYRCEVGYGILRDWQIRLFERLTAYGPPRPIADKKTLFTSSLQNQPFTNEGLNTLQNLLQFLVTTCLLMGQPMRFLVLVGFVGVMIMSWRAWKVAAQKRENSALDLENDKNKLKLLDEALSSEGVMMRLRFRGVTEETLRRFNDIVTEEFRLNNALILAGRWLFGVAQFLSGEIRYIVYLAVAAVSLMFGDKLIGGLTIGHLLTIIDLMVLLLDGGQDILTNVITLMGILGKYAKAAQELEAPLPQIFDSTAVISEPEGMRYDIVLTNASFGYQESVLSSVNCRIQQGEPVCIIGPNGVGKTTLAKTLLATIPLLSGEYTIGGYNAFLLGQAFFQRRVGHMGQFSYFKSEWTVYANLTINSPDIEPELFAQIMQQYGIPEDQWEVEIDRDGSPLSGGQRQRVMSARVSPELSPEYKIVVLDEPTTYMDDQGLALLTNNIHNMMIQKVTVIIITHDKLFVQGLSNLSPRVIILGTDDAGKHTIVGDMPFQEYIS